MIDQYERALNAINAVHTDKTASLHETLLRLQEIQDQLEMLIDGVREDIAREE